MLITDQDGEPVELEELDADGLLSALEGNLLRGRGVERDKLRIAAQWCVTHPATADTGVADWDPCGLPGVLTEDESLGGDGTPAVAGFAPEPLAAALQISAHSAKKLMADALDLQHRLPKIWKRVERVTVEPWKARKVAELTHTLSKAAAADVDDELAPTLASCSFAAIERAVAHAIATHHPELLEEKAERDKDTWDVTLSHGTPGEFSGTSWLQVTGDTADLTAVYDHVVAMAAELAAGGDDDPLGARKAKALAELVEGSSSAAEPVEAAASDSTGRSRRRGGRTQLFVHTSLADLQRLVDGDMLVSARVEGIGDVAGSTLQSWLSQSEVTITPVVDREEHDEAGDASSRDVPQRLDPATVEMIRVWADNPRMIIKPVLDLSRVWAVDGHDAPEAMREQVMQLNDHCVHPWCPRSARRADLDHIVPYVPIDEGGPPGQTAPDKIAPLCRRHHRCKTSGRWRYRRLPDGSYHWSGPYGRDYLVTRSGTTRIFVR